MIDPTSMDDFVNGLFEGCAGLAVLNHCALLYRQKAARGVSLVSIVFFTGWGLWDIYYYPSLDQPLSFLGGLFVVGANMTWAGMLFYYRRRERHRFAIATGAQCVGCGCDDFHACRAALGEPCYWLRVDHAAGEGVCSECTDAIEAWDAGRRSLLHS